MEAGTAVRSKEIRLPIFPRVELEAGGQQEEVAREVTAEVVDTSEDSPDTDENVVKEIVVVAVRDRAWPRPTTTPRHPTFGGEAGRTAGGREQQTTNW